MDNLNILSYAIIAVYAYTVYLLITTFHRKTPIYNKKIQFVGLAIFYLIITIAYTKINTPLLTMIANIAGFFLLSFLYSHNIKKNIQVSLGIYAIVFVEDFVLTYILIPSVLNVFNTFESSINMDVYRLFLSQTLFLLSAFLIKYFFKAKDKNQIILTSQIYNASILIITMVIVVIMFQKVIDKEILILVVTALIFVNLISILGYEQINKALNEQLKMQALKEKTSSYEKEIEFMDEQIKILRKYKHDEKNHFLSLMGLVKDGKNTQAIDYINNALEVYVTDDENIKTKNQIVNSILNYKIITIKQNNICLKQDIRINETLPISDYDLSIILGNLIDNAIDAQLKIEEQKRIIDIKILDEKDKFTIRIDNAFDGNVIQENRELISTKENKADHGIGIKSIKEVLKKYDGTFKISYDENKFTAYVMVIWDRK